MHVVINSLYLYKPCKYDELFPFVGNNLLPGQLVRVMALPTGEQIVVAALETSKWTCLVSQESLGRFRP